MVAEIVVDVRGLSCPQPALITRQSLQKESKGTIRIIVDSTTARENVCRAAKILGWSVVIDERSVDEIHVIANK